GCRLEWWVMDRGAGRDSEQRRAAAEERARARASREAAPDRDEGGEPVDEDRVDQELRRSSPEGRPMSRHYGGPDVYGRRRLFAGAAVVAIVIILFLLLGGC